MALLKADVRGSALGVVIPLTVAPSRKVGGGRGRRFLGAFSLHLPSQSGANVGLGWQRETRIRPPCAKSPTLPLSSLFPLRTRISSFVLGCKGWRFEGRTYASIIPASFNITAAQSTRALSQHEHIGSKLTLAVYTAPGIILH